jgi:hypothetical protein
MAPRSPSRAVATAALAAALAAGCAAPSLGPPTLDLGGASSIPVDQLKAPWPPSLMTHRAILSIHGRELPLDGRLAVGPQGALRLVALGPMGQIIFDVLAEPGAAPRVLRCTPAFPEAWVNAFAGRDLDTVFRDRPMACRTEPFEGRDQLVAPDGSEIRYFSDAGPTSAPTRPRAWSRIEGVREGKCIYRVTALDLREFEGLQQPVPSRIRIESLDYTVDLRVVDLKPGAPPERLFRPATEGTTDEHR